MIESLGEAVAFARKTGLDPNEFMNIIKNNKLMILKKVNKDHKWKMLFMVKISAHSNL